MRTRGEPLFELVARDACRVLVLVHGVEPLILAMDIDTQAGVTYVGVGGVRASGGQSDYGEIVTLLPKKTDRHWLKRRQGGALANGKRRKDPNRPQTDL